MAKAKSRGKSKSAGSHRKKQGARSGIAVDPILGITTYSPRYVLRHDDQEVDAVQFTTVSGELGFGRLAVQGGAPAGFPRSATVSDLGHFGRPKSSHKSWEMNPIQTGGMHFPEANLVVAMRDGHVVCEPVVHDEYREKVPVQKLPPELRAHFITFKCVRCGKRCDDSLCCGPTLKQRFVKTHNAKGKPILVSPASEDRRQVRLRRKQAKDRILRRIDRRAWKRIKDGSVCPSSDEWLAFLLSGVTPKSATNLAAIQIGSLLSDLPR